MPSTATLALRAASSSRFARPRFAGAGYAASSVVVTIGTRCLSTSSNCGITRLSDELVHSTATSGLRRLDRLADVVGDLHAQPASELHDVAGVLAHLQRIDVDGADDLKSFAPASCRATAAPIGPRPTSTTRIAIRRLRKDTDYRMHASCVRPARCPFSCSCVFIDGEAHGEPVQTFDQPAGRRAVAAERQLRHRRPPRPRRAHADRTRDDPLAQHQRQPDDRAAVPPLLERLARPRLDLAARTAARGRLHARLASDAWGSIERATNASRDRRRARSRRRSSAFIAPDDGNAADRTVMAVPLPMPVAPNETVEVDVEWTARFRVRSRAPATSATTTSSPSGSRSWACSKTRLEHAPVPRRHRVLLRLRRLRRPHHRAARLRRRRRRAARWSGRTTTDGTDDAPLSRRGHPRLRLDGEPRLHRLGADVRASRRCRASRCGCCCSPSTPARSRATSTPPPPRCRYYGEWFGPYPYGHITIVDPAFQSGSGGMEYPTLFTGRRAMARAARASP